MSVNYLLILRYGLLGLVIAIAIIVYIITRRRRKKK